MKILKIFGVVVGIHVFALILIFANPGCSSPNKPAPTAADTMPSSHSSAAPASVAATSGDPSPFVSGGDQTSTPPPPSFDPNAPAASVRFSPTRPGTSAAAALEAQPVTDVTPASTYAVAKGDSLWTIAKKHHLTVGELAAANNLKAGATVHVGQKIIIPGKSGAIGAASVADSAPVGKASSAVTSAAAAPTPKGPADSVRHIVRPGETLGAIARKYQVKVGEVATANNISDPAKIRPGMELTIPGWQTPSAKTKSAARAKAESPAPAAAAPSPVITPPPVEQDLDAGLKSSSSEPPVIQVEQK